MEKKSFISSFAKLVVLFVICTLTVSLTGCSGGSAPGATKHEVERRHKIAVETNLLQIQDEIDKAWMIDRPSRLSDKYTR